MRPEDNEIRDVGIEEVLAWTSTVGKESVLNPTGPEIPSDLLICLSSQRPLGSTFSRLKYLVYLFKLCQTEHVHYSHFHALAPTLSYSNASVSYA